MKLVIATGTSRGVGLALARRVAADPNLFLVGISRTMSAEFHQLMDAHPERIHHRAFDVAILDDIPRLVSSIVKQHGRPWALVNNAAIGLDGLVSTLPLPDIHRMIAVNLEAPILFSRAASRAMLLNRAGRIINISSIAARTGYKGLAVYAATKAGLEGFSRGFARELGPAGITVNCVAPGYMETAMNAGLAAERVAKISARAPVGLPDTDDIARMILFLLSEDAERITGAVMTVDGGATA